MTRLRNLITAWLLVLSCLVLAMPAQAANTFLVDNFETDTTGALPGWMTADIGSWQVTSASGIAFSSPNVLENISHADGDLIVLSGGSGVPMPATADMGMSYIQKTFDGTGNGFTPLLRSNSAGTTWYGFVIGAGSVGGALSFQLYKDVSGSISTVGGANSVSGVNWTTGTALHIKVAAIGTTISAKIWADGTSEPGSYEVNVTDGSVTAPGYAAFRYAGSGATSGNGIDNLQVFGNSSLTAGSITNGTPGATTVAMTVGAASGGTGPYTYQWYRSTSATFVPQTSNLVSGATGLTLNDTGLTPSTSYFYVDIATDSTGAIAWSSQASITTAASSATDFTFTPSSQSTTAGAATGNYTITPNGTPSSSTAISLSDGGAGGTFTPSSLTFTSATTQTLTYTPNASDSSETVTLTATASGGFSATHTASAVVTSSAATGFVLSPSSNTTTPGVATAAYSVTMNGTLASNESVALSDGSMGGTFTPSSLTFTHANAGTPQTFTYTPTTGTGGDTITLTAAATGPFSASHTATATVATPITAGAASVTYVGVKTLQMSASNATGGSGSYTYQWYRSTTSGSHGTALSGATTEQWIDSTASPATNYYLSLQYTDTGSGAQAYTSQVSVTTKAATAYEVIGGFGDSIEQGAYSTVQSPFSALVDQLNFGMPSREWYGGTPTNGPNGTGTNLSLNFSVSGSASNDWLPSNSDNYLSNAVAAWSAAGVTRIVTELGGADAASNVATPAATYQSRMSTIIAYLFANIPTLRSVHIFGPLIQGEPSGTESVQDSQLLIAYDAAQTALANGTTIYHVNPLGPFNYFQRRPGLQRSQDLIHPNDYGDQTLAGVWAHQVIAALSTSAPANDNVPSNGRSQQIKRTR